MDDEHAWRIAVHESAHAVAGRLLGLCCGGASADPYRAYADVPIAVDVKSVVALMAGAINEALVLGDYDEHGLDVDWSRATTLMDELGVGDGGDAALKPAPLSKTWRA